MVADPVDDVVCNESLSWRLVELELAPVEMIEEFVDWLSNDDANDNRSSFSSIMVGPSSKNPRLTKSWWVVGAILVLAVRNVPRIKDESRWRPSRNDDPLASAPAGTYGAGIGGVALATAFNPVLIAPIRSGPTTKAFQTNPRRVGRGFVVMAE